MKKLWQRFKFILTNDVRCPDCKERFRGRDHLVAEHVTKGKTYLCPHCQHRFLVPDISQANVA